MPIISLTDQHQNADYSTEFAWLPHLLGGHSSVNFFMETRYRAIDAILFEKNQYDMQFLQIWMRDWYISHPLFLIKLQPSSHLRNVSQFVLSLSRNILIF